MVISVLSVSTMITLYRMTREMLVIIVGLGALALATAWVLTERIVFRGDYYES